MALTLCQTWLKQNKTKQKNKQKSNEPHDFLQMSLTRGTTFLKECMERLRLPMSALAAVAGKF